MKITINQKKFITELVVKYGNYIPTSPERKLITIWDFTAS